MGGGEEARLCLPKQAVGSRQHRHPPTGVVSRDHTEEDWKGKKQIESVIKIYEYIRFLLVCK